MDKESDSDLDKKIDEVLDGNPLRNLETHQIPKGVPSDNLCDSSIVKRWMKKGMGHRTDHRPISIRRWKRELERLEKKESRKKGSK
tara:strand:+ start:1419 stop:1676 length:258 start_codon:yes stop_codon:yes gene_type:complete